MSKVDNECTQLAIDFGVLNNLKLLKMATDTSPETVKEILWTLSNIECDSE